MFKGLLPVGLCLYIELLNQLPIQSPTRWLQLHQHQGQEST